jgi:DNA-binding response OmpR family regulator
VLVVEDHGPCARFVQVILTEAGHTSILARTVDAALSALAREGFDALVCDLLLPDGHGCDIIRVVRQEDPALFAVAISGLPRDTCEQRAREAGFNEFLAKPFRPRQLAALFA